MKVLDYYHSISEKMITIDSKDFFNSYFFLNEYIKYRISKMFLGMELNSEIEESIYLQITSEFKNVKLSSICDTELELLIANNIVKNLEEYVEITNNPEYIEYFFEKFSVLNDNLLYFIDNIIENTLKVIQEYFADKKQIHSFFKVSGVLNDIILNRGDKHNEGKSVSIFKFNCGSSVVHKPRNLSNEKLFENLANSLIKWGMNLEIFTPKLLTLEDHGWMEFVEKKEPSKINRHKYYYNLGVSFSVFHILGTSDLIGDNFICYGEKPCFFDLECLFSPIFLNKYSTSFSSKLNDSISRLGITPRWVKQSPKKFLMSSALFPSHKLRINHGFSHKSNFELGHLDDDLALNVPNGEDGRPLELTSIELNHVDEGLRYGLKFLGEKKEDFLSTVIKLFTKFEPTSRVVVHDTATYSFLLSALNSPYYQLNKKNQNEIVAQIQNLEFLFDKNDNKIFESISRQLLSDNIPIFYMKHNRLDLFESNKNLLIKNFYWKAQNPLSLIKERASSISDNTIEFNSKILTNSYRLLFDISEDENYLGTKYISDLLSHDISNQKMKLARLIGDILISESYMNTIKSDIDFTEINWLGKSNSINTGLYDYNIINYELYDGIAGLGLYFGMLYELTMESKYKYHSKVVYDYLSLQLNKYTKLGFYNKHAKEQQHKLFLSPLSFPCCILMLNEYHRDSENYEININNIDEFLKISTPDNIHSDVMCGASGLIYAINSIRHPKLSKWLPILGERIRENMINLDSDMIAWQYNNELQNEILNGFAHGSSGIIPALSAIKSCDFNEINKALKFDRSYYDPNINGFLDGRLPDLKIDSVNWCHSSTGIGLSRLLLSEPFVDKRVDEELNIVAQNILNKGFSTNSLELCHGLLSNAEILKAIGQKLKNNVFQEFAENKMNEISDTIINNPDVLKSKNGLYSYGLFTGIAGIGYQMMRFENWKKVPSIIALESFDSKNLSEYLH